ncbi:hypothetical protein CEE69_30095 [Rhodopirellula bahusiensis]|uniref:Uncharacterized protein n=2 Tax=Rhodopirellula bahusiensis TaxID=2014065 RepID=A0A2G1VXY5_9BACT|nr:hypothetical protein CEE69_30095 [Rhodopirellula bahusiensis]
MTDPAALRNLSLIRTFHVRIFPTNRFRRCKDAPMAIGPLTDTSTLSIDRLYDLYHAIAERDHAFRLQSQYGSTPPPKGHCEFRPLGRQTFVQRVLHYDSLPSKIGVAFRARLARQAEAYGVDPLSKSLNKVHAA